MSTPDPRRPDPRRHAYRPDLADARLRGRVSAPRYVEGRPARIAGPVAPLHRRPEATAPRETELLFGERVRVFDTAADWAWVQAEADGYVGYVAGAMLAPADDVPAPSHRVSALRSFIFAEPDIKSPVIAWVSMGARLAVIGSTGRFAALATGGYAVRDHLMSLHETRPDWAATARLFLETPYLWGGRSSLGLDCSALVQLALDAAGIAAPRDTDMQERELGVALARDDAPARGDLIFWKGHVGILTGPGTLLHANATHMKVAEEPLEQVVARIAQSEGPVRCVRRITG